MLVLGRLKKSKKIHTSAKVRRELETNGNPFKILKRLHVKDKAPPVNHLVIDGVEVKEKEQIANKLNTYFVNSANFFLHKTCNLQEAKNKTQVDVRPEQPFTFVNVDSVTVEKYIGG